MLGKISLILSALFLLFSSSNSHKYLQDVIDRTCPDGEDDIFIDPIFGFALKLRILKAWTFSIISSILVGLSGVMPLLIIPTSAGSYLRSKNGQRALNRCLSFGVGSILGDTFLHLLPETWDQSRESGVGNHLKIGLGIICGILCFLIIEKVFTTEDEEVNTPPEESEPESSQNGHSPKGYNLRPKSVHDNQTTRQRSKNQSAAPVDTALAPNSHKLTKHEKEIRKLSHRYLVEGYMNLFANVIDNFIHGLAVGGSYLISSSVGLQTTFCIMIHEIPHEVSDFVILLRAGFDRTKAAKAQLLTASGSLFGVIFALCADSITTGLSKAWILPFTVGGFIYIALVSLTPALIKEKCPRESVIQISLVGAGLASMMVLTLYCD